MPEFKSFSTLERDSLSRSHKELTVNEIYAEPDNFLEIDVINPVTHLPQDSSDTRGMFTDYEIVCRTNIPSFNKGATRVRRRYSDFEFFRKCLIKELSMLSHPKVIIPNLPGKILLGTRFSEEAIEERRKGLSKWMKSIAGHPILQLGSKSLVRFIENDKFIG
ncbi:hypothetical protein TPHA_0N00290 [Tetrapisispora phaffii CBS 4417]|uniref:Sorting nexin-3 n=1 Tax=Tetrapisispora phaffii (strain ATCC 24235 / CBS 4417 / NBRC 1672 / NRRL Y-8282 / UCD 70-5) TaxID=1071381 RepID=G8C0Y2_TETPH|nr:hypothetical protein TPHA_0N00290 [Tetrapisispora phaffii CBS 4417]CCE65810.1 hypothetical protein TPHA_0N00290 [Tetrapisispora phaffii CBS 4417]